MSETITNEARRRKVYVEAEHGVRVPFTEVLLDPSTSRNGPVENEPVRLYDTSGPGSDPRVGLPPLRRHWILERGDVEEYEGRPTSLRDDGRGAVRRAGNGNGDSVIEQFAGERAAPVRAKPGQRVTQMHYARR